MGKVLGGIGAVAIAVFAVAMFFTGGEPAAEFSWASMPAEMDGVIHVDMRSFTATPFFDELMKRADESPRAGEWAEIEQRTGFDPWTDLHSLTFGGLGDPDDPTGTVYAIVRGEFDRERWFDYASAESTVARLEVEGHETWTISQTKDDGSTFDSTLVWVADDTAVLASAEHIDTMMHALGGGGERVDGTELGRSFASLGGQVRLAVRMPDEFREEMAAGATGPAAMAADAFKTVETMLFDVDVDSGMALELGLTADSADSGKKIYDLLNGYVALGKMFAAQKPEAAAALEALTLTHDAERVSLTLALSAEQIWTAVDAR